MDKWKFRDHATDPSKLKDIFRDVGRQKENDPRRKVREAGKSDDMLVAQSCPNL